MKNSEDALNRHAFAYEALFKVLDGPLRLSDLDRDLSVISLLSNFAWYMHPGLFCDIRLDNWALKLGEKIWASSIVKKVGVASINIDKRRILHVATETYDVGGHTRLLLNLIKNDNTSVHTLILTRQASIEVPAWLSDAVESSGGSIISLAALSPTNKVSTLQNELCSRAEKIFYHVHPDDSVAIAALAACPRPQVMAINHADHVFWLGSSLVDVVICYRTWSLNFSLRYRYARRVELLPTPIKQAVVEYNFKQKAKEYINLKSGQVLILTVAHISKFVPSGKFNYFNTIKKILDSNKNVLVKIVGVSKDDNLKTIGFENHDRLELLGVVENPQVYYEAADIYLDSVPFSSFTSLFEAMYFESFPILQFDPVNAMYIENEPGINKLVLHAKNEKEQIDSIQRAISDDTYRKSIAEKGSNLIRSNYIGVGWASYLKNIYDSFSEVVTSVNGSSANDSTIFTQDNIDAANLASSFYGKPVHVIMRNLWKFIDELTPLEIIKLYFIFFTIKNTEYFISLKGILSMLKYKAKHSIVSQ